MSDGPGAPEGTAKVSRIASVAVETAKAFVDATIPDETKSILLPTAPDHQQPTPVVNARPIEEIQRESAILTELHRMKAPKIPTAPSPISINRK